MNPAAIFTCKCFDRIMKSRYRRVSASIDSEIALNDRNANSYSTPDLTNHILSSYEEKIAFCLQECICKYGMDQSSITLNELLLPSIKKNGSALHVACKKKNVFQLIQMMTDIGGEQDYISLRDKEGKTPVYYALEQNNLDVVKFLIEISTYAQKVEHLLIGDVYGKTLLHRLVVTDCLYLIKILCITIAPGIIRNSLEIRDNVERATPFHLMCRFKRKDMINYIMDNHEISLNTIDAVDTNYKTALHELVSDEKENINLEFLESFLKFCEERKAADLRVSFRRDYKMIHWACENSMSELFNLIILRTPDDIHLADSLGRTPLHYACKSNSKAILAVLLDNHVEDSLDLDGNSAYDISVELGHTYITSMFDTKIDSSRESEIHPNEADLDSFLEFPLDVSSTGQSKADLMKLIKEKKCAGENRLHNICKTENLEFVKLFMENTLSILGPSKINAYLMDIDNEKKSPAHSSCSNSNEEIAYYLIQFGISEKMPKMQKQYIDFLLSRLDIYGQNILHDACRKGFTGIVKLIIANANGNTLKKTINKQSGIQKMTLLHIACEEGNIELVRLLIEEGNALYSSKDYQGRVPYKIAKVLQFHDIIKYFEADVYGAADNDDLDISSSLLDSSTSIRRTSFTSKDQECNIS